MPLFGVEEPFPWLLIVVWVAVAAPIVLTVFALIMGLVLCSPFA
jgi:hypothetical protein